MDNTIPKIVLFGHTGTEHLDKNNLKDKDCPTYDFDRVINNQYMPWNDGDHHRKFIKAKGKYISKLDEDTYSGDIVFWGEWEPATSFNVIQNKNLKSAKSEVEEIRNSNKPHYLHTVEYLKKESGEYLQNTDPYVFGDNFFYTNCKQYRKVMKNLNKGDIVLFGTTGRVTNENKYMELDTVFVVDEKVTVINIKDNPDFSTFSDKKYECFKNVVLKKIFERKNKRTGNFYVQNDEKTFIIYKGATIDNPINGMYSFFPCKKYENDLTNCSFGKVLITNEQYGEYLYVSLQNINTPTDKMKDKTPFLQCYKNFTGINDNEVAIKDFWLTVVQTVFDQGCYLGVYADEPKIINEEKM
ncbi:hypothetical protein [Sedimentibacter sp. B4]|uniref:hypothetical protein n=1 Tax=Sedimentibacter sp. B4 TaxID=304766 RepID=UPI0002D7CC34|nr:hypothetical protein [Sedimentibacter sp. B4]